MAKTNVTAEKHALSDYLGYDTYAEFENDWAALTIPERLDMRVMIRPVMEQG